MPFKPADRVADFGQSIFQEFVLLAEKHAAVDLSSGFPDFDGPPEAIAAVYKAMLDGHNQYALQEGEPILRKAVADHIQRFYQSRPDPDTEVTITNGAAEALHSIMDGLVNPGEEVIVFEPIYPYYPPNIAMAGGVMRTVPLQPPDWHFDPVELEGAFNNKTRAIILNTPHNPTGKIFSKHELEMVARLCEKWNAIIISDEVYEHLVYDGHAHSRIADLPGLFDRTLTVSSYSKTFSATGWRIGWAIGPPDLSNAIRLAHQYVLDCSATPMQYGAARALSLGNSYFEQLRKDYENKRDLLLSAILEAGMPAAKPVSGYFIMAEIGPLGYDDDFAFCRDLIRNAGVAAIPLSAFYTKRNQHFGKKFARFAFCKSLPHLNKAAANLGRLSIGRGRRNP